MPDQPSINVFQVYDEYATITYNGVLVNSKIQIDYGTRSDIKKLYSTDNGLTWKEYIGEFETNVPHIIAKSQKIISGLNIKNEKYISPTAIDAISVEAYDNMDNTYTTTDDEKFIFIDPTLQGKQIKVTIAAIDNWWSSGFPSDIKFYDIDNNLLSTVTVKGQKGTFYYDIPDKCVKISYRGHTRNGTNGGYVWYARLYEINISDKPIIIVTNKKYPLLTGNGIELATNDIEINYLEILEKKLYKINNSEWQEYKGKIQIKDGETIYAKGIKNNHKETEMNSYIAPDIDDTIGREAFDNNEDTCYSISQKGTYNRYMDIDTTAQGKTISVKVKFPRLNHCTFYFYDIDGNKLDTTISFPFKDGYTNSTKTAIIPDNAVKMEWNSYLNNMSGTVIHLCEIKIIN